MKRLILALAAATTLLVGTLATPNTAEAQWRRGGYYGPYYGGYYRPSYGGYYRPYSQPYYSYRPYYSGNYYRPNYGQYYYGSYPYRYYGYPGYYSPDVRIGAGPVGVRVY